MRVTRTNNNIVLIRVCCVVSAEPAARKHLKTQTALLCDNNALFEKNMLLARQTSELGAFERKSCTKKRGVGVDGRLISNDGITLRYT